MIENKDQLKYLPSAFQELNGAKFNYELCFDYLNEVAKIRHNLLNGKPLNWNLQITYLLTPIYADLNGLLQHG